MYHFKKDHLSSSFSNARTNSLLTLLKVRSVKRLRLLFTVCLEIADLYLFHLIALSNPFFNCSNNLFSFSVDKVTTGTYNLQSVIENSTFVGLLIASTSSKFPCAAV